MHAIGIIPARYDSKRFPGKPLAEIEGKSMIQRVYEQVAKCKSLSDLVVATDDKRIFNHVIRFGKAVMTDTGHRCGTERCLEAFKIINKKNGYDENDALINIQGDQPYILPEQISTIIEMLKNSNGIIATLMTRITEPKAILSSDAVKVVFDKNRKALYFSRSPIPFCQTEPKAGNPALAMKHIGIYGFHIKTLKKICQLPISKLELSEGLEQLRWLENGYRIQMTETDYDSVSIDRKEDIFQPGETI